MMDLWTRRNITEIPLIRKTLQRIVHGNLKDKNSSNSEGKKSSGLLNLEDKPWVNPGYIWITMAAFMKLANAMKKAGVDKQPSPTASSDQDKKAGNKLLGDLVKKGKQQALLGQ